jgi:predicted lipoprotein with Yx(FWY)xxD motif
LAQEIYSSLKNTPTNTKLYNQKQKFSLSLLQLYGYQFRKSCRTNNKPRLELRTGLVTSYKLRVTTTLTKEEPLMNYPIATNLRTLVPPLLAFFLAACGDGGNGGYKGGNNYSSTVYTQSSNGVSSNAPSTSSPANSSANSSATSSSANSVGPAVVQKITSIGGTFVGNGTVNVLLSVGGAISTKSLDKTGMTLYVFDVDPIGQSACTSDACITAWPPLLANAIGNTNAVATAPFTIITRADGNLQWALRDKPLYFFVGDLAVGDVKGEGVSLNNWHVAQFQPVLPSKTSINAVDGTYLTASGHVLVGVSAAGNASIAIEQSNRDYFSLYTFDTDTPGVSNCNGGCAANWPPLLADDKDVAEAPYSIITRKMGTNPDAKQWAYQGMPLYFFKNDLIAGDTNGKAIPKWHLARPMPVQVKSNATVGSLLAAAGFVNIATPSEANPDQFKITSSFKHGFTLYTFDNDSTDVSNCVGACLANWPALIADFGAVAQPPYSLVTRASGIMQWALNGRPLYFYVGDTEPGTAKGDYLNDVWHAARVPPVIADPGPPYRFNAHGKIIDAMGAADNSRADHTLYTFDSDTPGVSTCVDGCLATWPALYAPAGATAFGDFTVVSRPVSGDKQWAYKGKPLYFFVGDTAPDQTNGSYPSWTIAHP